MISLQSFRNLVGGVTPKSANKDSSLVIVCPGSLFNKAPSITSPNQSLCWVGDGQTLP